MRLGIAYTHTGRCEPCGHLAAARYVRDATPEISLRGFATTVLVNTVTIYQLPIDSRCGSKRNLSGIRVLLRATSPSLAIRSQAQERLEKLFGTKLESLATVDPTRVLYNALDPVRSRQHWSTFSVNVLKFSFTMTQCERQARAGDT